MTLAVSVNLVLGATASGQNLGIIVLPKPVELLLTGNHMAKTVTEISLL
jgi:hypothetical protein